VTDADYHRRIEMASTPTSIDAEMEDHHHHFRVHLDLKNGVIAKVETTAVRAPWTTCATGAAALERMNGLTIAEATDPRTWGDDRSAHCTHAADLALLAVRHATDATCRYDATFTPANAHHRTATLTRDGTEVMRWTLDGAAVTEPFGNLPLDRHAFLPWIRANLDEEGIEHAMILRRAATIAMGNAFDLDAFATAADVHPADNTCHTYRVEIASIARRNKGSSRIEA
jgi:hypothetical protein